LISKLPLTLEPSELEWEIACSSAGYGARNVVASAGRLVIWLFVLGLAARALWRRRKGKNIRKK
jgi:hypothetical protein